MHTYTRVDSRNRGPTNTNTNTKWHTHSTHFVHTCARLGATVGLRYRSDNLLLGDPKGDAVPNSSAAGSCDVVEMIVDVATFRARALSLRMELAVELRAVGACGRQGSGYE